MAAKDFNFHITEEKQKGIGYCIVGENPYYTIRFTYIGNDYHKDIENKNITLSNITATVKTKKEAPLAIRYIFADFAVDTNNAPILSMIEAKDINKVVGKLQAVQIHLQMAKKFFDEVFPPNSIKQK